MIALAALTACGGSDATATPTTPVDGTLPTVEAPTPTPAMASPTAPPAGTDSTPTPADGTDDNHILALGEELYQNTAGGLGCAYCHQADATGDATLGSPAIRGVTEDQIWDALDTRVQMSFITMTDEEVRAVAAYLKTVGN